MTEDKTKKYTTEEIEIFEERFEATKEEIVKVVDNHIKNHHFGGIEFLRFEIGWQDHRRMYYGVRKHEITIPDEILDEDIKAVQPAKFISLKEGEDQNLTNIIPEVPSTGETLTLGYIEVTPLRRLSEDANRIRVICIWPPVLKYWHELSNVLKSMFPVIDQTIGFPVLNNDRKIYRPNRIPQGAKSDPNYDEAYLRLQQGEDFEAVYELWCKREGIDNPDKYDRKRLNEAMRRRDRKRKKKP